MAVVRADNPYAWRARGSASAALRVALWIALLGLIAHNAYAYAGQGDSAVLVGGKGEFYLAALPPGWDKRAEAADASARPAYEL